MYIKFLFLTLAMLDENGFDFIRQCIKAIEDQGF